ncbi:SGNH/GDSL hydrolase family protein [[Pseudomonas] boreopolis]|uniref:SGNH/GDSL hydrolase family protein n=1 Tax=Xanthomonas boreopolis TaxID=86183 RepID=UPI003DA1A19B
MRPWFHASGSPVKHRIVRSTLLVLALLGAQAQALDRPAPKIPEQVSNAAWEEDMRKFAAADAVQPPPQHGVLFVGSSSIRFWDTLATDFPGQPVINRGFGGSEVRDSTWYADRIVVPYAPRLIVFYAGDNDLAAGRSPAQVRDDFVAFVQRVRKDLPDTRIAYISIKPSPSRAQLMPQMAEANRMIRHAASRFPKVDFIDVYSRMLDASGKPRPELFREDQLHMTRAGYEIWRDAVALELARK